ncbi:energy-coupling factor transporter transmembrane protein EcfT [Lacrimispora sp. NSJ-141]|uniref:Energy-coupling factor transporter transmembrane protein EcfT n=1 Tax=Lientehia hominis TaxID=2897778 RepID=A0AAP2W979_9FIRM|nr:energy-coupling factor transporter transmembrane component T [Lientehia hominis]MCD2491577.1 energy-coupling factor transporter transmembrane protein EcfT [Lientehia hominis]
MKQIQKDRYLDPRMGALLLVLANVAAFSQKSFAVELSWIIYLTLLTTLYGCWIMALKWLTAFAAVLLIQWYVLPASPMVIATSFSIFANYARRMFPCLIVGMLMVKRTPLRNLIVGMRMLHIPQKLIIAISVTLRYFPAIREELGYIRDAMKLRNIHGAEKVECLAVPMIVSAAGTAEELSAAAVTRGIENPVRKTSAVQLRLGAVDALALTAGIAFTAAAFVIK